MYNRSGFNKGKEKTHTQCTPAVKHRAQLLRNQREVETMITISEDNARCATNQARYRLRKKDQPHITNPSRRKALVCPGGEREKRVAREMKGWKKEMAGLAVRVDILPGGLFSEIKGQIRGKRRAARLRRLYEG
ncbi:hypothetical protein MGYG_09043 [Nannizzia gypsea CBS 118893]|uniref:Uncharacterized protein n=1 Tax=Arthroderma gypseum (strain ATCC MYA-4604 / CBS 118893) TaxID=535722 RepID=E4URQ6_ARTGP|nr:hypothetical protein MGYG_09043 [Nannizzia gypsea CBS 118893]EFR01178.1 hypothetical protein MGYG_09043 [Nannizzia gypsea CBS 118893]